MDNIDFLKLVEEKKIIEEELLFINSILKEADSKLRRQTISLSLKLLILGIFILGGALYNIFSNKNGYYGLFVSGISLIILFIFLYLYHKNEMGKEHKVLSEILKSHSIKKTTHSFHESRAAIINRIAFIKKSLKEQINLE